MDPVYCVSIREGDFPDTRERSSAGVAAVDFQASNGKIYTGGRNEKKEH